MILNFIIMALIFVVLMVVLLITYKRRQKTVSDYIDASKKQERSLSESALLNHVKATINEYTRENLLDRGYSEEEYHKQRAIRKKLKKALKQAKYGSLQDKEIVKDHIYDILRKYIGDDLSGLRLFDKPKSLTARDKFDILLYVYKVKKGYHFEALDWMIKEAGTGLDAPRSSTEDGHNRAHVITEDEIASLYEKEEKGIRNLTYKDRLNIVTQRIYQQFKGLGVIDEIRDMAIDGVSGGVSGELESTQYDMTIEDYIHKVNHVPRFYDSVWIMLSGQTIHLSFLSFGSLEELRRVCQNIYAYKRVGQLSERSGYKINEMADGSRVVVVRPPFAESWAFFVRKFNLRDMALEDLYRDQEIVKFLRYLVRGARVIGITGAQGTGKTTLLMALVKSIYATLTLRIQETAFELHLRNIYPTRNILTFRETDTISGQDGLDVQKKTDGSVNIIGEVASHPVASWMIQAAQVASLFTIFTHHAKTSADLVESLRNSMLYESGFSSEAIAEKQVAKVLNYDIHLSKDSAGHRFIERITEINPTSLQPYPMDFLEAADGLEAQKAFYRTQTEYFRRMTDRKLFETRVILCHSKGSYKFMAPPSPENVREMMAHMTPEDKQGFGDFLMTTWGTQR